MTRIGIIGLPSRAGSMIRFIKKSDKYIISGIFDFDTELARKQSKLNNIAHYTNPNELIRDSEIMVITKSSEESLKLILESIQLYKPVVIESPYNLTVKETDYIEKLAYEANLSVVPSLVYSFSPTLLNVKSFLSNIQLVELNYSTTPEFKILQSHISENLLNLIDIVLNLVKSNIRKVAINGLSVTGSLPQIITMRFDFDNGSCANLKANYISNQEEMLINTYQPGQLGKIDLLKNISILKNFKNDNLLNYETIKPIRIKDENPYHELFNYIETFHLMMTPVSALSYFKNTLSILKIAESKLLPSK